MSSAVLIPVFSAVRHQPVARRPAAARRRHVKRIALIVALCVLMAFVYAWIRIQVIQMGYEVSRIRKETNDLKQQKQLLEADVGVLKSPARIEKIAKDDFGMRLPQSDEVVIVGE